MSRRSTNATSGYLDRISTKQQSSLILALLVAGVGVVALVSTTSVNLIRREILHLSRETSPTQVKVAKLQRGFEQINGDFARISLAMSVSDLSRVDAEMDQTLNEVRSINDDLGTYDGMNGRAIRDMRDTGEQLSRIAREQIESRSQIREATRKVSVEIQNATSVTRGLSKGMAVLRDSSQRVLLASKDTSFDANSSIQTLLTQRERLAQLRACVREVRTVDRKFRLNVLRGTSDSILDTMASSPAVAALGTELGEFERSFAESFSGKDGLIAARAAVLSVPANENAKALFKLKEASVTMAVDSLSRRIAEEIDPLELAVLRK